MGTLAPEAIAAIKDGMNKALKDADGVPLLEAIKKYATCASSKNEIVGITVKDYNIMMAAAASKNVDLFRLLHEMGGEPFSMDEASGDTPFSVVLFYMNRKGRGSGKHIFEYLLEAGAMKQETTYYMSNLIWGIWEAGIGGDCGNENSKTLMDACFKQGLDILHNHGDYESKPHNAGTPLHSFCSCIYRASIDCMNWMIGAGHLDPVDLLETLGVHALEDVEIKDAVRKRVLDPSVIDPLIETVNLCRSMVSQQALERDTLQPKACKPLTPRF